MWRISWRGDGRSHRSHARHILVAPLPAATTSTDSWRVSGTSMAASGQTAAAITASRRSECLPFMEAQSLSSEFGFSAFGLSEAGPSDPDAAGLGFPDFGGPPLGFFVFEFVGCVFAWPGRSGGGFTDPGPEGGATPSRRFPGAGWSFRVVAGVVGAVGAVPCSGLAGRVGGTFSEGGCGA